MKKLNELNRDELRRVFDKNKELREIVFDHAAENANFWINEYLNCFESGALDYSLDISGYYNYFTVKDFGKFLAGLDKVQKMYCFLADEYNEIIKKAAALNEKYQNEYYYNLSDLNYERIENRLTELIEILKTACYDGIRAEYAVCNNDEYLFNYFINGYLDEMNTDNFYINENYELFEHVEYERKYE